jgi:HlyD family secretion protein
MKKKIIIGVVLVVVIAGVVLGFTLFGRGSNKKIAYKKEAVDKGNIEALVVTTGTLNPVNIVEVGSQVSGKIEKLYVDFNSQVKNGQLLAELDKSLFEAKVQQNEANYRSSVASLDKAKVTLDNTKKKYERDKNLFEKNLISFEEMEATETQYYGAVTDLKSAEARVEQAKSTLDSSKVDLTYTIIRSPIDGVVISRNINVGQTVAASFQAPVLFKIANDLSKMQMECSVDEADIGKVKEGQRVRFNVYAYPDETFTGVVSQVRYSAEVVQNVVTYTTIVEVENPEIKLRPGMTATVSIVSGEAKDALRVPNSALRFTPNLSAEEMKKIMESMRTEIMAKRGGSSQEGARSQGEGVRRQDTQRQGSEQEQGMMFRREGGGVSGSQMRQVARVWTEDEKGKLKLIFIRTGVTDNTYTQITWGDLKEGQLIITGLASATTRSSSQGPPGGPGMMFIRR